MAGHPQWRIYVTATNGSGGDGVLAIGELIFRDSSGSSLVGDGTGSASSSSSSYPVSNAFSGDGSDSSWSSSYSAGVPHWLAYDFGSPVDVVSADIYSARDDIWTPRDFEFQYSDNGTDWVTVVSFSDETGWDAYGGESRSYEISNSGTPPGGGDAAVRSSKVSYQIAGRYVTNTRLSSVAVQAGATYPRVGRWSTSLQEPGSYDYVTIPSGRIVAGRVGAICTGTALGLRVTPRSDYPDARLRGLLYTAQADGTPGALIQVSNVVVGLTTDEAIDLPFPGKPRVYFGNYYLAIWSDTDIQLRGEPDALRADQQTPFGGDPGLSFSGSASSSGVPRMDLMVDQNAQTLSLGGYSGSQGADGSQSVSAGQLVLGQFYNLSSGKFQAAAFEAASQTSNAQFRLALYDSTGSLIAQTETVTGAVDEAPTVGVFPSPVPLTTGSYYLGVVSDSGWRVATFDTNDAYDTQSVSAGLNSIPESLTGSSSVVYLPVVRALHQDAPPYVPALKSPLLQIWSGVGDVGPNFVGPMAWVTEQTNELLVSESGTNMDFQDGT